MDLWFSGSGWWGRRIYATADADADSGGAQIGLRVLFGVVVFCRVQVRNYLSNFGLN